MIKTPLSTVIGGAFWTPGATVIGGQQSFSQLIKSLFANNEQGFAYDPNDLSTMYQDDAGTVPVTGVGQPLGLVLDKSKGLVSGSNVATGFTSGFITANSVAEFLTNNPAGAISSNWFPVTPNAFYRIHAPVSNRCRVQVKNASGVIKYLNAYSSETLADTRLIPALADSVFMRIYFANEAIGSQVTTFDVRKLAGNHTHQTTSAARPILRDAPQQIDFDAVDDKLITDLPTQLSGCTVIRSAPNVGTQILTGQTIPATYEDNTDHCGLIVINRALTPSETSAITAEFNKRAGV